MKFLDTIVKVGLSSISAIIITAIVIKLISINYGPQGVGEFGLVRDSLKLFIFAGAFSSTNAILNGLNSDNITNKQDYLSLIFLIYSMIIFPVGVAAFLYLKQNFSLINYDINSVFIGIFIIFCGSLTQILSAILNAYNKINLISANQFIAYFISLIVLAFFLGSTFIIYFLILYFFWLIISFTQTYQMKLLPQKNIFNPTLLNPSYLRQIISFAGVNLTTTILGILTLLSIKTFTIVNSDVAMLGQLEAGLTPSLVYMAALSSGLGAYIIPKYSVKKNKVELDRILKILLCIMTLLVLLIKLFKTQIIGVLFSSDFLEAANILGIMISSDLLKIFTVTLTFVFLSDKKLWEFFVISTIFNIFFYIGYIIFWDYFNITSAAYSYVISNLIMFIVCIFYSFKNRYIENKITVGCYLLIFTGLLFIQ